MSEQYFEWETRRFLLGDFNLDYEKIYNNNYCHKTLFKDFEEELLRFNFIQVVNFVTWSRMIGTERKTSALDHIYVKDPTVISKLKFTEPFFGDHVLIEFCINTNSIKCLKRAACT